jgi:hypothetical protein
MVARRPTATAGASGSNSLTATQPSTGGTNNLKSLTVHEKRRKKPWYMKTLNDRMQELFTTPGKKAREEIVETIFGLHQCFPADWTDERINEWIDCFQIEEDIEDNDPVSVDDAISRARQDVDSLLSDMTPDELRRHLFSPVSELDEKRRPSPEQLESQWMTRWINPSESTKRDFKEWGQVIGFTGEYLVSFIFLTF